MRKILNRLPRMYVEERQNPKIDKIQQRIVDLYNLEGTKRWPTTFMHPLDLCNAENEIYDKLMECV